ncbi:protein serine/threonine kinase [Pelomyxa schiedti]|nr:protein serine/threonine kinase [Pelomyxa schiedti]
MPVTRRGWLTKEGGNWKSWKRRWFVLDSGRVLYFAHESDRTPKGTFSLENAAHIRIVDHAKQKSKLCFQVATPARTYYMFSENNADRLAWIDTLNAAVNELHPKPNTPEAKVGVDDFELLKVVGKGSFGKVMQVRMRSTGAIYAMKVLSKKHIVDHHEVTHTMAERSILQKLHHPFLMNLNYSFQTAEELYFILDFVNGGEVFYHLQREKRFSLERVRFYAAEILLALEHLHNAGVVYRDLKPENLLLTNEGHICITDFGLCKEGLRTKEARTDTFCGTPEYLAPEVLLGHGYGKQVDWWSFGSLLFEMLTGLPPFYSSDVQEMYRKIMNDPLVFPPVINEITQQLLVQLLERDPERRLCEPNLIKTHKFFDGIDWDAIFKKTVPPPFVPTVAGLSDTSQIDPTFTEEAPSLHLGASATGLTRTAQQNFEGFTYNPMLAKPATTTATSSTTPSPPVEPSRS